MFAPHPQHQVQHILLPATMTKKWQFVSNHTEDGTGKDAETRRLVRKTAMKAFRRSQRLERTSKFMQEQMESGDHHDLHPLDDENGSTNASSEPSEDIELPRTLIAGLGDDTVVSSVHASSPHTLLHPQDWDDHPIASGFLWPPEIVSLDPFGSSPLGSCSTWHHLFTHFVYQIAPMIQPLGINSHLNPVNTVWAHHAMTDPALFHGILFHASVHVDLKRRRPWSSTTLIHRGETIRLVNERLNGSKDLASDETIGAVGWVASEGNITGDVEGNQVHWDAIQRMLKMRGGLQFLGWNGALEMLLTMGNIISSMVEFTPPVIERPTLTGSEFPDIPSFLIHDREDILTLPDFGDEIISLLRFMSELTVAQSTLINTAGATPGEIITFNKLRSAAEHRLLSIRVLPPTNSARSQLEAAVYEGCRAAALMCTNIIFREFIPSGAMFRGLRKRLLLTLTEIKTLADVDDAREFEELLLWVYFIGGMNSTEKEQFGIRVAKSMSALGYESWAEVENCLFRCLWAEKMRNDNCIALWQEVTKSKELSEGGTRLDMTI